MVVTGLDAREVGDLAFDNRIRLHRLAPQTATLEEAFLAATEGDEEFQAAVVPPPQRRTEGVWHERRAALRVGPDPPHPLGLVADRFGLRHSLLISVLLGSGGHHDFSRNGATADAVEGLGPVPGHAVRGLGQIPSLVGSSSR